MDGQLARPTSDDDREGWKAYWTAQGMPWRTEPEIGKAQRAYLAERRGIQPSIERGIYPFRDENGGITLTRADVEWLLATLESDGSIGPIDWKRSEDRSRPGLDLRGAILQGVDLSNLPLARLQGGVSRLDWDSVEVTADQRQAAAIHLAGAQLHGAHLEQCVLSAAHLEGANLRHTHLAEAILPSTHLEGADLTGANLEVAAMWAVHLEGATLNGASLRGAGLVQAHLQGVNMMGVHLEDLASGEAHYERADIYGPHFEGASLRHAQLGGAQLDAKRAACVHHWVANFPADGRLPPANLRGAFFDGETMLHDMSLGDAALGYAVLTDVTWGNVNLSTIRWMSISMSGSEWAVRHSKSPSADEAVRANRQLAVVLRSQGLNEPADHFAYRGQVMQRAVLWRQLAEAGGDQPTGLWYRLWYRWRKLAQYCGSWILWVLSGYGYLPGLSLVSYLLIVGVFAVAYHALGAPAGHPGYHISWLESAVVSLTAFHGRGFFAQQYSPGDPQSVLAAGEAVIGLLIEITFIATFTQRFFAR